MERTRILIALLALIVFSAPVLAQGTSSLQGTVTDPSGAVIPAATIEITNVATQATMTTQSNEVGAYRFPQVPPGTYNLRATAEGLTSVGIPNIELLVAQPTTIDVNFQEVGSVTEIVSVEAETAQINTVDATIGNAVGTRPILELPFEARNVVGLLSLQPGVAYTRDTPIVYTEDTRNGAVNGGKSDQANITLDGVDVNNQQSGTAFSSVLRMTLDSVQEFRTTTLNASADEGRASGAQVALITKSGTNELHGSAYYYLRHDKTAAADFFSKAIPEQDWTPGVPRKAKLRRHIYGGSIGGPIKKNRLFYFFNYEGRKDRSEQNVVRAVPSASMRQGMVKYINVDGGVTTLTPTDLKNVIDPLGIGVNQNVLDYFNKFPMPNDDTQGDNLNVRGFRFNSPVDLNYNTYITKWDYYVDQAAKHQIFFRGNYQDDDETSVEQFPGSPPRYRYLTGSRGLALGYNATLSSTMFNAFRYGFTRLSQEESGASTVTQTSFRGLDDLYPETRGLISIVPVHTFRDDMSWIKGNHTLKFGGVIRVIDNRRNNLKNSFHSATTNSSWLNGAGKELSAPIADSLSDSFITSYREAASYALGLVSQTNAQYNYNIDGSVKPNGDPVKRDFAQEQYEFYINDTWRVLRGLTITAGLRYGLTPPIYESNGIQTSSVPSVGEWFNTRGGLMTQGRSQKEAGDISYVLRSDPAARGMYPYHKKNFAPRLAIAYSPQTTDGFLGKLFGGPGRTSIRAGFGMFYDNFGQGLMRLADSSALGLSTQLISTWGIDVADSPRFQSVFGLPPGSLPDAPPGGFPQEAPKSFEITNGVDDTIKPPYSMALNLSIGRELPQNFFVEVSYVGRLSRRSLIQRDLAMPTDLADPDSGQSYFGAAKQLANYWKNDTPIEDVPKIAYWENMWPDLAGDGLTATQGAYDWWSWAAPDYTFALYALDVAGWGPSSKLGEFALFNEQYSALSAWSSIGHGDYHAAQFTVRKRWSQGVQFDLNYTFSKSIDLASVAERVGDFSGFVQNSWSPHQVRAVSDYDMRHQVNAFWVAELPFGRGKKLGGNWGGVANAIFGGWQISGLWRQTSGMVTAVNNGRLWPTNWNLTPWATQTGANPTQGVYKNAPAIAGNAGPNIFPNPETAIKAWDHTDPGESGQRNGVRGDGYFTLDMGLMKWFQMPWEGHRIQFRWEVFNITNSVRFDAYSASLSLGDAGSFGKYESLNTNPRVMQFALRYEF